MSINDGGMGVGVGWGPWDPWGPWGATPPPPPSPIPPSFIDIYMMYFCTKWIDRSSLTGGRGGGGEVK